MSANAKTKSLNANQIMPKSELHCHLDGCVRTSTLYQYGKQQNITPKSTYTMHETIQKSIVTSDVKNLKEYLDLFVYVNSIVGNNKKALRQVAEEFCFDKFNDNVRYVEVRYSPHFLAGDNVSLIDVVTTLTDAFDKTSAYLNEKYESEYETGDPKYPKFIVKQILCGIWNFPTWLGEVVDLIEKFDPEHKNIVAIDVACDFPDNWFGSPEAEIYKKQYQRAKDLNIRRTIHAGECSGPKSVIWAIDSLNTERIGHGYELQQYKDQFEDIMVKEGNTKPVHFEYCPLSSIFTTSQKLETHALHKVKPDKYNFSISTDNSGLQFSCLTADYDFLDTNFGWKYDDYVEANLNGLRSAFSPLVDADYIATFEECYRQVKTMCGED